MTEVFQEFERKHLFNSSQHWEMGSHKSAGNDPIRPNDPNLPKWLTQAVDNLWRVIDNCPRPTSESSQLRSFHQTSEACGTLQVAMIGFARLNVNKQDFPHQNIHPNLKKTRLLYERNKAQVLPNKAADCPALDALEWCLWLRSN